VLRHLICILVAFLFNWIGFLLLMCFCHTIAARYGALSGFGLSLAKWTLIVKHSTDLASRENIWLWWLIMAFGKYIIHILSQLLKFKMLLLLSMIFCRCFRALDLREGNYTVPAHQT
jgi:hypothetical protein